MLGAVEFQQEKWDGSDQEFTLRLCKSVLQRLTKMFESFIVSCTGSITHSSELLTKFLRPTKYVSLRKPRLAPKSVKVSSPSSELSLFLL
jgi:hypothetical protein